MVLLLSLVLLADPRATAVDMSFGAAAEVRFGRAPLNPGEDPIPSFLTSAAPIGRLHVSSRGHDGRAVVSYSPRVLFRFPNQSALKRPLLLHQMTAGYSRRASPRLETAVQATADVGELDYTSAQAVFGEEQGNLPSATITRYASTNALVRFSGALTPVHQLTVTPSVDYRTPYGDDDGASDPVVDGLESLLPRQVGANLTVSHSQALRPTDTLLADVLVQYVDFDARGAHVIGTASYGWRRGITSRLSSTLRAGVFATTEVRSADVVTQTFDGVPAQPLLAAELDGRLYNRSKLRISGAFGVSNNVFLDSVTGEVVPRAGASTRLAFFFPPSWTAALEVNFFTVATGSPRDFSRADMSGGQQDPAAQQETALSWRTPVSYNIRNRYGVEFGTIWSVRGPHLRAGGFRFRQLESWLYVAFSFDYATGHLRQRAAGGGGSTVTGGSVD